MSGAPRNPDKLNTIGIVVVGVCGAVLVYVSIVALQAFYMNDTSDVQAVADYGGQESTFQSIKASQNGNLVGYGAIDDNKLSSSILDLQTKLKAATTDADRAALQTQLAAEQRKQRFHIPIERAMQLVVADAAKDPAALVPGYRAETPSVVAAYGRPTPLPIAGAGSGSAAPAAGSGSAAPAEAGSAAAGSGSGSGSATSSANPPAQDVRAAAPVPTGGGGAGGGPTGGTGPLPAGSVNGTAVGSAAPAPPVGHAP